MRNSSFIWLRPLYSGMMLIVLLLLTGCWSSNEINNLATISIIGIDENDVGQVEVTTVIAKPYALFPEISGSGEGESKFLIETTTGESIFDALGQLSSAVSETLYFGHLDTIVFGERAAREIMESSLDFFKRESEFRPNIQLLVTRGSASNLVKTLPQLNLTLGMELNDLVLSNRFAATGMVHDISQFTEALASNTKDPITGVISPASKQGIDVEKSGVGTNNPLDSGKNAKSQKMKIETNDKTEENQQDIPKALSLKEIAVFKGGQLKGFLDEHETRGLLWVKGEMKNEIVNLSCRKNNEGIASLKVTRSDARLSPQISGEMPKMQVDIQVEAEIGELTCTNINMNTHFIDHLNKRFEDKIRQEVSSAFTKAKNQWQTDIFGFGQAIYRNHPERWRQMVPQWRNGLLKDLEVNLNVSVNISRHGILKDPIVAKVVSKVL